MTPDDRHLDAGRGVTGTPTRLDQLQARLRQLILMRETGPKRPAWHAARARMIWRLHNEIARERGAGNSLASSGDSAQQNSDEDVRGNP